MTSLIAGKDGKQRHAQTCQVTKLGYICQTNNASSSSHSTAGFGARGEVSSTLNSTHSDDFRSWTSGSCTEEAHLGNLPIMGEGASSGDARATDTNDLSAAAVFSHLACDDRFKSKTLRSPEQGSITTLYITNVPTFLTHGALLSILEDAFPLMRGNYDFYYCPWDEQNGHNLGFALLNFPNETHAEEFQQYFAKHPICRAGHGQRLLSVLQSSIQGLEANLFYFSQVEVTACSDLRFRPLYRDTNFRMQPLPLQVSVKSGQNYVA